MPNTLAPFGFSQAANLNGSPTYQLTQRLIAANNTTKIFKGDPAVSLTNGYIAAATPGTTQIAGIFAGCSYFSQAQNEVLYSPYWPGNGDSIADVKALIITAPNATFIVQANGNVAFSDIGSNANFAGASAGNTKGGASAAVLDTSTIATTATLPFRILSLVTDPAGANGTDALSPFNWVIVGFNNQDNKSLTGI